MKAKTTSGIERVVAPKSIKLKITRDVINDAQQRDSSKCMMAQCLRSKGYKSIHVTAESMNFNDGTARYSYPTPKRAALELIKFDKNRNSVKPFTVTLSANTGFVRPITKRPERVGVSHVAKRTRKKLAPLPKRSIRRFNGVSQIQA